MRAAASSILSLIVRAHCHTGPGLNAVLLPWRSNNPTRRGAASGACADKRNSGVMNLPCNKVAKYCTAKMFAAKLAVSCPKTCGKCGA